MDPIAARHGLPHPLALLYGRLAHHDPVRQLENLLAFAEGVARFLAWVLTAEAAAYGASASQLRSAMSASGFGSFLGVIKSALDARAKAKRERFLPELDALPHGAAWTFLDRVKDLRNDASHNRLSRDPHTASALLAELSPGLPVLLDAIGPLSIHPFGVLRGQETDLDGVTCATWFPIRGQSLSSTPVRLRNVAGMPTGVLLLVDVEARRALTLAPFFLCDETAFCWMDIPKADGAERRGCYQRAVPGEAVPAWVPEGLFVGQSIAPQGMKLAQWLADERLRPRVVQLSLDGDSIAGLRRSMQPTLVAAAPSQAANILAIEPDRPSPDTSEARRASLRATRHRAPSQRWIALALSTAAVTTLAVGWFLHRDAPPSNVTTPTAPTPTAPAPRPPPLLVTGPLRDDLRGFFMRWEQSLGAITRGEPASVSAFYSEPTRLRGSVNARRTRVGVDAYWRNVFRGTIRFDWSTAQTAEEPLDPTRSSHDACALMLDARPGVTLVRVDAVEDNPQSGIETIDGMRCSHIQGKYLLRVRRSSGGYLICHDSWSLDEAICPSCPNARDCARR